MDDIKIDLAQREVYKGEDHIRLTKIEMGLLRELVTHPDQLLTYRHLLQAVWGEGYEDNRLIHVHVCHLRRKLEADSTRFRRILAVPRVGYRFRMADQKGLKV